MKVLIAAADFTTRGIPPATLKRAEPRRLRGSLKMRTSRNPIGPGDVPGDSTGFAKRGSLGIIRAWPNSSEPTFFTGVGTFRIRKPSCS